MIKPNGWEQGYSKIMLEWIESQWKLEKAHQEGEPYTRMKFEAECAKLENKLKDHISQAILSAGKEGFKKGYIKGALDREWGQTTADEEMEKIISQTRNDFLREIMEEMPKKKEYEEPGSVEENCREITKYGFNDCHDQVNTLLERKLSTNKK